MDHNRRGLALMLSALLISILVASVRSCNEQSAEKYDRLDALKQTVIQDCYTTTRPVRDYRITSIENGIMTVEVGPSLSPQQVRPLAVQLTTILHDREHVALNSDYVGLDMYRAGRRICSAHTTEHDGVVVRMVR